VLDRLIGGRLIALEAHEIGIDALPEVKRSVADYAEVVRRGVLEEQITKGIAADPNQVELIYREAVREWRLSSALFAKEADARAASVAAKAGAKWEDATKQGERTDAPGYVRAEKMLPQVAAAVRGLFAGQIADPIDVAAGWALVRVDDLRYPDDPAEHARAEARSLDDRREQALTAFVGGLVRSTVAIDDRLLRAIDFEARRPGFAALEKDRRVLARVRGGKTFTVADLAKAVRASFFHGIEDALQKKTVNEAKLPTLDKLVRKEAMRAEAKRRRIEQGDEYRRRVAAFEESVVFGAFVQRAIVPGLKITEDEGKAYYQEHQSEFTWPAFYKLQSLAFTTAKRAQAALDQLHAGFDFAWLKRNAEGQIAEEKRAADFTGGTVSASALPEALAASLKGARAGDRRLQAIEGQFLVIEVLAATPEKPQPYPSVRAAIAKKLSAEKVKKAVDDWVAKLRKAHEVKVYLAQIGV
jgi:parvulin-like peptidyl-prolyl isomerase